jgi:hypothetical protein
MTKVFLAYPHRERELASQVASALSAAGLSVWFDEAQIRPGDEIASAVREGLQSASAVVLLLGSQSYGDSWARREAALALSQGKRIFPILPHKDAEVPYILRHLSYLDLSDKNGREEKLKQLAAALSSPQRSKSHEPGERLARSEALNASAEELQAEIREYERSKVTQNWTLAAGTISAVISTVVSVAGYLLGTESNATSKYFYIAVGGVVSISALVFAVLTARYYVRKSEKKLEVGHE